MSYYNTGVAPSYPFTPAAVVIPADNNLAAGASPHVHKPLYVAHKSQTRN